MAAGDIDFASLPVTAQVTRREGEPPDDLLFHLEPSAVPLPSVPLEPRRYAG